MDDQTFELVERLLDENTQLHNENSRLRSALDHYEMRMEQAAEKIEELEQRYRNLLLAPEFYAEAS